MKKKKRKTKKRKNNNENNERTKKLTRSRNKEGEPRRIIRSQSQK